MKGKTEKAILDFRLPKLYKIWQIFKKHFAVTFRQAETLKIGRV